MGYAAGLAGSSTVALESDYIVRTRALHLNTLFISIVFIYTEDALVELQRAIRIFYRETDMRKAVRLNHQSFPSRCDQALETAFVCRWPINRRHRHVEQTQIHAELRPVMDQMIHHEPTHYRCARQSEDWVSAHKQRPLSLPVFITGSLQRSSRRRDILVKGFEQ